VIRINKQCIACGVCVDVCPVSALRLTQAGVVIDRKICVACGICYKKCPVKAIVLQEAGVKTIIKDIRFQVTKRCNFDCLWCYSDAKYELPDELSLEEALHVAKQLVSCGLKTLTLTGGEPLLREDFCLELLRYLKKQKVYTKLFTNGSLLNDEVLKRIKGLVNEVQVSNYNKKSWPYLASLFAKLRRNKIRSVMRITLTSKNYAHVKDLVRFAERCKVDCLRVRPFIAKGRGSRNIKALLNWKIFKSIEYLVSVRRNKHYPIQLLTPSFAFLFDKAIKPQIFSGLGFRGYTLCKCIEDMGSILPDGRVRACGYFPQDFGNIRKERFSKIWSSKNKIKANLIVKRLDNVCMECLYVAICGGGCRASAYITTGSLTGPDPYCPRINRIDRIKGN